MPALWPDAKMIVERCLRYQAGPEEWAGIAYRLDPSGVAMSIASYPA